MSPSAGADEGPGRAAAAGAPGAPVDREQHDGRAEDMREQKTGMYGEGGLTEHTQTTRPEKTAEETAATAAGMTMTTTTSTTEPTKDAPTAAAAEGSTTKKTTVRTTETTKLEGTTTATSVTGDDCRTTKTDASPRGESTTENATEDDSDVQMTEDGEESESMAAKPKMNGEQLPEVGAEGCYTAPTLDTAFEEL